MTDEERTELIGLRRIRKLQSETIQRQQEQIRVMQILLREIFNHLGKSDDLKERINEVIS